MTRLERPIDFVVCFWYAERTDGGNFFMTLKKQTDCWQLDWRFSAKDTKTKDNYAVSGLQVKEKQVTHEGCEVFKLTREEYPLRRYSRYLVGGDELKLRIILKQEKLIH